MPAQLLTEAWPEVADELRSALAKEKEAELAESVDTLRFLRVCPCGDDFCQSVYTGEGDVARTIAFETSRLFAADISAASQIVYVEILYRDDLKTRFGELAD